MSTNELPAFDTIAEDFAFIDDWDEKYRYLIDLGRQVPPIDESAHNEANKVRGCASQVWLVFDRRDEGLHIAGDSDAAIVKGLMAILIALYAGRSAQDILSIDAQARLAPLGLADHITPQRSNGLASMITRIRETASQAG
jgi:cysteine desulfuration protein SufE